ncbi:MAG: 4-hydroxy-tetrahydrodipicolinate reductase [Bacteroidaceae bacterium]|nr:4-hydroxy-tetrahydrodipicolinate reductase [Bacteroidaceae bacterium]
MRIALIGYGKMGHEIERVALSRGHSIVCRIDVDNLGDIESEAFRSADVAIEFTAPTQAYNNVLKAFKAGVKVVSGSTGWMEQKRGEMQALCEAGRNTLFWSSNFSLGVALFSLTSKYLARLMNGYPMYDVSMSETHHVHKLDAPSGTAITLAEGIIENIDRKNSWTKGLLTAADGIVSGRKECPADCVRVDSVREGEVPGVHTIVYDSPCDEIIITHSAKDRSGLALGAVLAAEYTCNHSGFLTMGDLLGIR